MTAALLLSPWPPPPLYIYMYIKQDVRTHYIRVSFPLHCNPPATFNEIHKYRSTGFIYRTREKAASLKSLSPVHQDLLIAFAGLVPPLLHLTPPPPLPQARRCSFVNGEIRPDANFSFFFKVCYNNLRSVRLLIRNAN